MPSKQSYKQAMCISYGLYSPIPTSLLSCCPPSSETLYAIVICHPNHTSSRRHPSSSLAARSIMVLAHQAKQLRDPVTNIAKGAISITNKDTVEHDDYIHTNLHDLLDDFLTATSSRIKLPPIQVKQLCAN